MVNRLLVCWTSSSVVLLIVFCIATTTCWPDDEVTNYQIIDSTASQSQQRTFRIDYNNNQFLKDGQPFRFVAGSFHYFRALPQTWQAKFRTMRAAGLNAVTTYVEWSLHNPHDGQYEWTGVGDLVRFVELAAEERLLVILRPGPYICAERDMGGFPYWLLHKYPNIKLRTNDPDYLNEASAWFDKLMPQLHGLLYENGGPIIMVQVENEYGSFGCNQEFRMRMKQLTESHVRGAAVLFTNDGPSEIGCGKIDGVLATMDFGTASDEQMDQAWSDLRKHQPKGPLVNAEFYPGWLTHWQEPLAKADTAPILNSLRHMLNNNASVNFYMFFGGTNFGFTAGANDDNPGHHRADITSYDYDAPMDEAGDPTAKYYAIRKVIGEYLPLPDDIPVPVALPKMSLGNIALQPVETLLSKRGRIALATVVRQADQPMSFEALDQNSGFILYETKLPRLSSDPSLLIVNDLHDRAMVYIDDQLVGILSRETQIDRLPIHAGCTLQIMVENQGRINFNIMEDFKGILGDVKLNDQLLQNWTHTGFPFANYSAIEQLISEDHHPDVPVNRFGYLLEGPQLFHGEFDIEVGRSIYDTYLDPRGWGKGIAFINGFNLGRYWPVIGPQITLYVPKDILQHGKNHIVLIEMQRKPADGSVQLVDTPNLDGF